MRRFVSTALLCFAVSGHSVAAAELCWPEPGVQGEEPAVWVLGEVASPGHVALATAATARAAVREAGGVTLQGYPMGAMLLRSANADVETVLGARAPGLAAVQMAMEGLGAREALALRRRASLIHGLQEGRFRRLPVAVDAATTQRFPTRDVTLQAGDVVYLPARGEQVAVLGAVGAPGLVAFQSGSEIVDYVAAAGGWARGARRDAVAAYLPQGDIRSLSPAFWDYHPQNLPPGSVLLVPEDTRPGWVAALAAALPPGLFPDAARLPEATGDAASSESGASATDARTECEAPPGTELLGAWR